MGKRQQRRRGNNETQPNPEQVAIFTAAQIAADREERAASDRVNRRIMLVTAAGGGVAALAAIVVPFASDYFNSKRERQDRFAQQIDLEIQLAKRLKSFIEVSQRELAPGTGDVHRIESSVGLFAEQLRDLEEAHATRELKADQDTWLSEIYVARRDVFLWLRRALQGAIAQVHYERSLNDLRARTTNYMGAAINVDMAFNRYVHALRSAAEVHRRPLPTDLWMIDENFTGPMMADGN